MNDQSNVPAAPRDDDERRDDNSLIERAVERFDLHKFAPLPVPDKLAPPKARVDTRRRAAPDTPSTNPEPVQSVVDEPSPASHGESTFTESMVRVTFGGTVQAIDRQRLRDQGLIVPEGEVTTLLEEFRIVKRQLLRQAADLRQKSAGPAAQRVLVCSPHSGEGKTYCSVNLALSIAAEKESEVVLVDADFAKPAILDVFGFQDSPGLMDALTNEKADVADFVLGTDIPGLWVLPAGDTTNQDSEYLSSSRTATVLDRLTQGAPNRMVIFDSPPALAASPAAELAKHVAQAMMIVRADSTGQGAVEDAITLLSACPNIQLLLNATHFSPSGRRFGAYYGHGG